MRLGESMENNLRRCVLVLGAHRAGTSVLARSLTAVGVELGGSLIKPQLDNPKGFFEDQTVNEIDQAFLHHIGIRWDTLVFPSAIVPEVIAEYQDRIKNEVCNRFFDNPLWGLKDPRISRLWHLWLPVLSDVGVQPVFILASRHPLSVAQSLARRDNMPQVQALALWAFHQLAALGALAQCGGLVVDYDLMMNSPRQELHRIAHFLGTADRLDLEEITRFESDFLSQELRHSQFHNDSTASPLQSLCLDLHAGILELAQLSGGLADEHIAYSDNLASKCCGELAKSIDWMQAIDDLQGLRCNNSSGGGPNEVPQECEARLYLSEILEGVLQNYTELRGAATLYPISKQRQTIRLPLPADLKSLASIRLDPANCPVALWLHCIALEQADGSELWRWNGDAKTFVNIGGLSIRNETEGLLLLCLNDDPQFDLAVPSDVFANLPAHVSLLVELTPQPLTEVITKVLNQNDRLIADLRADLLKRESLKSLSLSAVSETSTLHLATDIENIASLLKNSLDRRDQTIAQQAMQFKRMREELLRAEAQLDLLKDVMLGGADYQL